MTSVAKRVHARSAKGNLMFESDSRIELDKVSVEHRQLLKSDGTFCPRFDDHRQLPVAMICPG